MLVWYLTQTDINTQHHLEFTPMKKTIALTIVAGLVLAGVSAVNADKKAKPEQSAKLLRHVVLFQFKEGTSTAKVKEITSTFAALPGKIDAIEDFEWGTDVSVENKTAGFTHGFLVTFRDAKGRAEYLPHPAHQNFVRIVGPHVENVLVFDYWTK
jgi:outer membrane murein-binding lipoprotein Lpp